MTTICISADAENDLDAIWLYIANDSEVNADRFILDIAGTRTETLTNRNGVVILTSVIETITSIDGKSITINRDSTGGGWFDQTELRLVRRSFSEGGTTYADGHRTLLITDKNADGRAATNTFRQKGSVDLFELRGAGAEIDQATTTLSIDGFTRSVGTDMDSDAAADCINTYDLVSFGYVISEAANDNQQNFALQLAR